MTEFLSPGRVYRREEVLARPSPVPPAGGVYGWWFRRLPPLVDPAGCRTHDGLTLLYAGISPRQPPRNGRAPSRQGLWQRLTTHYAGNAEGPTLRKTLGCLLAEELSIELRRVGSGQRKTFGPGEQRLSAWMADNALVSWVLRDQPWELEETLIAALDLPLNLDGNTRRPLPSHPHPGARPLHHPGQRPPRPPQPLHRRPVTPHVTPRSSTTRIAKQ